MASGLWQQLKRLSGLATRSPSAERARDSSLLLESMIPIMGLYGIGPGILTRHGQMMNRSKQQRLLRLSYWNELCVLLQEISRIADPGGVLSGKAAGVVEIQTR
ncbi:hypothetical protein [Tatumella ptyseos]|uniref:Uncharacterized protein n=1 Tax=Tatumella ptyseos TaxID=82987 RepID=A0A2X5PNG1_9GAMM|nr:hypothetical protein [Tatumella ptyseos]SQK74890.1 Uncharacterised protein [Tatumella ptyseos]